MSDQVVSIVDWNKHYENSRSRDRDELSWVPIPNNHDSLGYSLMMMEPDAGDLFAAWILLVQVASRCDVRGTLTKGGKALSPKMLEAMTRFPKEKFERAFEFFSSDDIRWLKRENIDDTPECPPGIHGVSTEYPPGVLERKKERREGKKEEKEKKEIEKKENPIIPGLRFPEQLDDQEFRDAWRDWVRHKTEMGRPPTIPETEIQLAKLSKEGLKRATDAVRLATERGWMSIHVDALDKKSNLKAKPKQAELPPLNVREKPMPEPPKPKPGARPQVRPSLCESIPLDDSSEIERNRRRFKAQVAETAQNQGSNVDTPIE